MARRVLEAIKIVEVSGGDNVEIFLDIMSGITADGIAESEGWTFADAWACTNLSVETLAAVVIDTSQLPAC